MRRASNRQSLDGRREQVRADICIIGAGIAGLVSATRIASRSNLRVVVLESGTSSPLDQEEAMVSLDAVHDPAGSYEGVHRGRGIGGSSAKWAGKLLPLSPHDMAARPYLDLPAWPIGWADLACYMPEIETMMQVDTGPYESAADPALDVDRRLPPGGEDIVWRWPKRPTRANHRLDHVLRRQLARLHNLCIWTDATVSRFSVRAGRLAQVYAGNHRGGTLNVSADRFIIAAGTLETTRLLLLADQQNDAVISSTTDALGRYFNDHFALDVVRLRSPSPPALNRTVADRSVRGTQRHLHGELSPQRQQQARVGSAYFDFDRTLPPHAGPRQARATVKSLRERQLRTALRHAGGMIAGSGPLAQAIWYTLRGEVYWPDDALVQAKIWIEQMPIHANRLFLGNRRDSLGDPMLEVELERTGTDERTFQAAASSLQSVWSLGRPEDMLDWSGGSARLADLATEHAHPAGSTRMGLDPATSVVDPDLRIHALPNVQVASASVFPTSGSANPTLTIMQLAMLAADRLVAASRG